MEFTYTEMVVKESERMVEVPIRRLGDCSQNSSVICYTRQNTAVVMMDYTERPLTEASRVMFLPGEKVLCGLITYMYMYNADYGPFRIKEFCIRNLFFFFLRLKTVLWGLWMTARMNQWNFSMCGWLNRKVMGRRGQPSELRSRWRSPLSTQRMVRTLCPLLLIICWLSMNKIKVWLKITTTCINPEDGRYTFLW